VEQEFGDALAERFRSEISLNPSPMTDGNSAGLFRDNHRDGVGFFGDPKSGPMTQAQAPIERFPLADRENARGGRHATVADDYAAIVQRTLRMK
jgi:hypothetical protein